ncbi:MAG: GIY-YIG nuclease family protein [Crocinitomicaceae bacterium]|nr:GIY-YIG nuclease family protein [Crocinitomicaceae bacterium]
MNYAIVDIETTGGSPKQSKITEIAIYKFDGNEIIDEYQTLINPEIPIPPFIVQLTGISDEMVKNSPRFFEIAKDIVKFTKDCVFVAHNVSFDYGMLRTEFRSLGFDYRLPHLCTVRSSRFVIPGHESYSLGKLTRSLGIDLVGRHRAGGDALATAKLFKLLYEKDPDGLKTFIQEELNPKKLHPNLDLDALEEIPNKVGIYKFYNEVNQLIYIGKSIHIRKRIEQHLGNLKTKKGIQMQQDIARIEFELTGSELIALLLESRLIKQHQPIFNRALKRDKFPFGLYQYIDEKGYIHFVINKVSTMQEHPLTSFSTKKEGVSYLEKTIQEYSLCQKLCNLYKTKSACFQYGIKECKGACIQEEKVTSYNQRAQKLIKSLTLNEDTFYILGNGRNRNERSLVFVENGSLKGFGYAPFHMNKLKPNKWDKFIDLFTEDRDARTILKLFLRKEGKYEIVRL